MHPVFLHLGPITLYSYGLLVALAFLTGSLWAMARARQAGENADLYLQGIFWMMLLGFIGARVLYVIYFPQFYLTHPLSILLDRGGLVWYGGLVSAVAAFIVYARIKNINIFKFGDILAIPAALGLAIGRIGCFMSGCCYGKPTMLPWGVQFPVGHETYPLHVHPTELYESAALLVLMVLLLRLERHSKISGMTLSLFFVGYGIIRFLIEYLRGDVVYWIGHYLTASQVFSVFGILVGLAIIAIRQKQASTVHAEMTPL